jgi:hypothetical protein
MSRIISKPKTPTTTLRGANIKTVDIETAPTIAYVWRGFKENIFPDQVLRDGAILSYAVKDLGVKKVRYDDNSTNSDFYDDKRIVQGLWKELDEADIVIGHNAQRFDVRKINARFLAHDMPPPSPYKVIDTMLHAKQIAAFWSNRLAWIAEVVTDSRKDSHGAFPGFKLWKEALAGNPKAWAAMRKYNPIDVEVTEAVYLKLRPYMTGHPSLPLYSDGTGCPRCGSQHVEEVGTVPASTRVYTLHRCNNCHSFSRGARCLTSPKAQFVQ